MLLVLAKLTVVGSTAAQDLDARRARALASFDAVVRADRETTSRTRADLEVVVAARPDDALARVHLGWLLVLAAREKPMSEARTAAGEGFRHMDAAVAAAPEDPAVRLVRARSDYQMPLVLGREPMAEADFKWLLHYQIGDPLALNAPPSPALRREILFHAGAFALKRRNASGAVALLEEAATVPAGSPTDAEVQSMLALARRELSSQNHAEEPPPHQIQTAAP